MRVLLVDDEPLILEGLQALINWNALGISIIGSATNGEEALNRFSETACDLVITDIRMPRCSGLELISKWQQVQPSTRWIVLSGYQDFEYVKQGLTLGIENYLLKPVDADELEATVKQVSEKRANDQKEQIAKYVLRDNAIWRYMMGEMSLVQYEERMRLFTNQVKFCFCHMHVLIIPEVLYVEEERLQQIQLKLEQLANLKGGICIRTPKGDFLFFTTMSGDQTKLVSNLNAIVKEGIEKPFFLLSSESRDGLVEMKEDLKVAMSFKRKKALFNETAIMTTQQANELLMDKQVKEQASFALLQKYIAAGKQEEAVKWLKRNIRKQANDADEVRTFTAEVAMLVEKTRDQKAGGALDLQTLLESPTVQELEEALIGLIEHKVMELNEKQQGGHIVLQDVLQFIQAHMKEDLSLKELGNRFFINAIYLGQLFQKEIGMSFSEYVNKKRLELAKDLLVETHMKAGQIGKEVGYSDATYFYKQFKKGVGITPNEYRHVQRMQ